MTPHDIASHTSTSCSGTSRRFVFRRSAVYCEVQHFAQRSAVYCEVQHLA